MNLCSLIKMMIKIQTEIKVAKMTEKDLQMAKVEIQMTLMMRKRKLLILLLQYSQT